MTPTEKRLLRQKVQVAVADLLVDMSEDDEQFFLALLYANEQISHELSRFDDVFEENDK